MTKRKVATKAMRVERVDIMELKADPRNTRKHGKRNIEAVKKSLQDFGQQKPIVVDGSGKVVAGNGTLEAALALGWTHIDVVRTKLKGAVAQAYAVADNQTAVLAEWDNEALADLLRELQGDDSVDHFATGFSEDEIRKLLGFVACPECGHEFDPGVGSGRCRAKRSAKRKSRAKA